jgi:hypothetical protein
MTLEYLYPVHMSKLEGRLLHEHETFRCMAHIYCGAHHGGSKGRLCTECADFMQYAEKRLEKCPYGDAKPTCAKCPIHCYKPAQRETARRIMRYAGPRMTWRHPIRALRHLLDKRRRVVHPLELRAKRQGRETTEDQGTQASDKNQERPAALKP